MGITAVVLLASFAAQPPPPPPLLDEPTEIAPEAEPQDPPEDAQEERRIVKPLPGARTPPPEVPSAPKQPQLASDIGLDAFMIGALQWAVPCATFVVIGVPCTYLTFAGCPPAGCALCLLPAVNGYLAAYIGDRFGNNRAPAIWTVLAAHGAGLATVVASGVLLLVIGSTIGAGGNPVIDPANPVFLGGMGTAMLASAGASLVVPAAYALTAEPKRAGDLGDEGPGWFAPNHPTSPNEKKQREPADAPPRLTAMRF